MQIPRQYKRIKPLTDRFSRAVDQQKNSCLTQPTYSKLLTANRGEPTNNLWTRGKRADRSESPFFRINMLPTPQPFIQRNVCLPLSLLSYLLLPTKTRSTFWLNFNWKINITAPKNKTAGICLKKHVVLPGENISYSVEKNGRCSVYFHTQKPDYLPA